jgi:glutathione synthase/RimK-type ligase-like ATP-grasp enzyme
MIAIHNSFGFSERWIKYCDDNQISYKIVNAYDSDIVSQLKDCSGFMWHFYHKNYKDRLFAKQLLYSLQLSGIRVFPDYKTCWHFDDKVGQKYLLEAIEAPLVPTYVFYLKSDAQKWIEDTSFPKVFKLTGGAGAENVKLVKSKSEAKKIIEVAFRKGFRQYNAFSSFKDRLQKYKSGKSEFKEVLKGLVRFFVIPEYARMIAPERGYVYFQDFIPDNSFDIRVVVVEKKAFALKRLTREGDFRASGSGNIIYRKEEIDERCIEIAFSVNQRLKTQSIAFDFIFDKENKPLIVEISFGYSAAAYDLCEGFWTEDMIWHEGTNFDFCGWMVEDLINNDSEKK